MISVVIPFYNVEKKFNLLSDCVNSVLLQSNKDFEIVFVDDGSVDQTSQMFDERILPVLKKNKINHIYTRLSQNQGVCAARNCGFSAASGEYVAFMDFDDLMLLGYLNKVQKVFSDNSSVNWVLSPGLYYLNFFGLQKVKRYDPPPNINNGPFCEQSAYFIRHNFPAPMGSGIVVKKEPIQKAGIQFSKELNRHTSEDVDYGYQMLAKGFSPLFLEQPYVIHRSYMNWSSRSRGDLISADHLFVNSYIWENSAGIAFENVKSQLSSDEAREVLAHHERQIENFSYQSDFVKGRVGVCLMRACTSYKCFKMGARLLLVSLTTIGLPNFLSLYEFFRAESNQMDLHFVQQYLERVKIDCNQI